MLDENINPGVSAATPINTIARKNIFETADALEAATPPTDVSHMDTTHIIREATATSLSISSESEPPVTPPIIETPKVEIKTEQRPTKSIPIKGVTLGSIMKRLQK